MTSGCHLLPAFHGNNWQLVAPGGRGGKREDMTSAAVIGCGDVSVVHLAAVAELDGVDLVGGLTAGGVK